MPNVRGAARHATALSVEVSVPLLVTGIVLLLLVMAAYFRLQYRRERRQLRRAEYLPPLQQATTEAGLLDQISQRKQSLQGFIAKLRTQLEDREQQLRAHDELEGLVTSRRVTSRQDDVEWRALMKAGRRLHGDNWTASKSDGPSLRELMETHKDELLDYKRSVEASGTARRSSRRPDKRLSVEPLAKPQEPRAVPPQWQSTRRLASSVRPVRGFELSEPVMDEVETVAVRVDVPGLIPRLNLEKLRPQLPSASHNSIEATEVSVSAADSSFEAKFHRQTRLARMFSRRKT